MKDKHLSLFASPQGLLFLTKFNVFSISDEFLWLFSKFNPVLSSIQSNINPIQSNSIQHPKLYISNKPNVSNILQVPTCRWLGSSRNGWHSYSSPRWWQQDNVISFGASDVLPAHARQWRRKANWGEPEVWHWQLSRGTSTWIVKVR